MCVHRRCLASPAAQEKLWRIVSTSMAYRIFTGLRWAAPKRPGIGIVLTVIGACDRKGFLEYLDTQAAALGTLAAMPSKAKCAMRCFEADPTLCHRSLVAGAIAQRVMPLCGTS